MRDSGPAKDSKRTVNPGSPWKHCECYGLLISRLNVQVVPGAPLFGCISGVTADPTSDPKKTVKDSKLGFDPILDLKRTVEGQ